MTTSSDHWPDALLAGLACSMRTFAGPGLLAVRGRLRGAPRIAVLVAAAGELAADKSPIATDRTDPPALAGRIGAGAYTGHRIAGPAGAAAGALGATVGTFATWRARSLAVKATGLPDPAVAVAEDIVAEALAALATRPGPPPEIDPDHDSDSDPADTEPRPRRPLHDALVGLAAGAAGTAAMTIVQGAEFAVTDAEPSSAPADVADALKRRAGRGRLKRRHRPAANHAMHWLYGTSWGIPYGLVASSAKTAPEISGPVFGLTVWAVGLIQQPALGVAELPWKRSPGSLASEALVHLVYGAGAGAAVRALRS
jgi:uncharacterized membrane protein